MYYCGINFVFCISMSYKEKILFIVNPVSGKRNKKNFSRLVSQYIDLNRFNPKVVFTEYRGHAIEIVKKHLKKKIRYFVAVGGDGTVNEIASVLINTKSVLGIIPMGSGNGLARHLQIPMAPAKAFKVINQLVSMKIDYGLMNKIPFFCTCGVGFDALIGDKFAKEKQRGFETYVMTTINELLAYKPQRYTLEFPDYTIKRQAFLITFANSSQYGNNAYIAPNADIADGLIDICVLNPFPKINALGLGVKLFSRKVHKSDHVEIIRCSKVILKRANSGAAHYDGEPCKLGKKIKIQLIHKGLQVIVPEKFKKKSRK